jgi:Spy/CpxP family protein refolding chaperone
MKRLSVVLLLLTLAACATYDDDQPPPERGRGGWGRGGGGGGEPIRAERREGPLDMLPRDQWWREPRIADAVKPSSQQVAALDELSGRLGDEIQRLERDSTIAARDLRTLLEAETPTKGDIATATQRMRGIRDSLFDRQAELLASERTLLTRTQWSALQDALQERREDRMNRDRGGYPGRGGYPRPGRGRVPG